jgi:dienelactone hydrolase
MQSESRLDGERDTRQDREASRSSRPRWWTVVAGLAACLLGVLSWLPLRPWFSAIHVLLDLAGPAPPASTSAAGPSTLPNRTARVQDITISSPSSAAAIPAHLYVPAVRIHRCVVIGHGVHYKGIDEPRLVRFATELAGAGAMVLTPELADLADYRITRSGADVLGSAVRDLSARCAGVTGGKVGLLGFSFAGGLSLLAAESDPEVQRRLAYVASVGGYDDLGRVLHFLLNDEVVTPHGTEHRKAHEYGIVVLLYENLDRFVDPEDRDVMRAAVRAWLHEDRALAWWLASRRTTLRSEKLFTLLASGHVNALHAELEAALASRANELRELSPAGRLASIDVPVYVLHGSADSVIPPEETVWAGLELGNHPHKALVTPLLEHVELSKSPPVGEAFALVDFIAGLL